MAMSNCNSSLLVETSVLNLIEEVEKRPALYRKSLKEYSDVNQKKKLWEEVCEVVVPNWNQLSAEDKTQQGRDVQKKWANLRTCFRRELNAQKNTKSGQAASKRRKYIYFEELLFLLPCMENRQTEGNLIEAKEDDSQEDNEGDFESNPSTSTPIRRQKKRTNISQTDLDEALLKSLKSSETVDEDTNFALSLVPSLQNLTAEEKLDAKIGILNIFKQIRAKRVETTSQTTSRNYNVLQQPLSSFPVYHRGTNILPSQQPLQAYAVRSTPSPNSSLVQNIPSPDNSNDTAQSYFSNFSDDAQIYDLG